MSIVAVNHAVRHEVAPNRAALEERLHERAAMSHIPREVDAKLFAYHHHFVAWRYFASALVRRGRTDPFPVFYAIRDSDSPLAWAVRARHHVAEELWLNTPEEVLQIDECLRGVTGSEFARIFQTEREAIIAEYESSGLSPERARESAGPEHFGYEAVEWGNLRAFYARAAAEERYVVSKIST